MAPSPGWAAAGAPVFLAAARDMDRSFALYGVDATGADAFRLPLPARAHAGAAHPQAPLAVVFARRPGTFALVVDCAEGRALARLETPEGRHFMGHGCFSHDGALLMTAENGYDDGRGRIGLWSRQGWRRQGEFLSHGIGPHDILPLPGGGHVIANGGIATHPARGPAKLNLATMRPNLAYVDAEGRLEELVELAPDMHRASIRHLAVRGDGLVAFAMQFEGDAAEARPLLGLHRRGGPVRLLAAEDEVGRRSLAGYVGAVAFDAGGARVAITSPVGGVVQIFDVASGRLVEAATRPDICGLGLAGGRLVATDGLGGIARLDGPAPGLIGARARAWDNHVIPVDPGKSMN